jgi:hypothetical protein
MSKTTSETTKDTVAGLARAQGVTLDDSAAAIVAASVTAAAAGLPKAAATTPFEAEPASFVVALARLKEGL